MMLGVAMLIACVASGSEALAASINVREALCDGEAED